MAEFDQTTASRAVLVEVANVLGAFRNHLVVVGGWVPELLFPNREHIGSLDVDLAVAPTAGVFRITRSLDTPRLATSLGGLARK